MAGNPVLEAAVQAVELDAFNNDIPDLIAHDDTFYSWIKNNAQVITVAQSTFAGGITRPSFRVPMRIQAGAAISQGTGNADSLGRGSGSQWTGFALPAVFYYNVCEIAYLPRIATEGRKRGLFNIQAAELKNTFKQAVQGLEAQLVSDGQGTLNQIPSTATINNGTGTGQSLSSIVNLNNSFNFQDQQLIQVIPAAGPPARGTFTVSYTDPVTNTIFSAGSLPVGTVVGDFLTVAGSPGTAGSSILGIRAWNINSNTGVIGGLSRANYPSRLSTPTINLQGASLALSTGYRAEILLGRALGPGNEAIKNAQWITGPDQKMQMSNLYFAVMIANAMDQKGDSVKDMVPGKMPITYAGRDVLESYTYQPGRLDLITPDTWRLTELQSLQLYDFGGGQTTAPVPDLVGGGYLTSSMFAYTAACNLCNANPRAALYITNAAIPVI